MQILKLKKIFFVLTIFAFGYYAGSQNILENFKNEITVNTYQKSDVATQKNAEVSPFIGIYTVSYIVDGDTIHVKDKYGTETKVRFLAVNTLEKNSTVSREKCLAEKETVFTNKYLQGKNIEMYADVTQPKLDKYGRTLAYVKIVDSDKYFNQILVETGNAKTYKASPKAAMFDFYQKLEEEAKNKQLGMWNLKDCT